MQPSEMNKGVMSPLVNERMRKRRCFADKELEMVMLERERQAEVMANHRHTLHQVMHTHNQQVAHLNGLRINSFQQQSVLNLTSSRSVMLQEGLKKMHAFQDEVRSVIQPQGTSSPKEFLQKVFPAHNASLIELVWQGCGGDLERTIEQLAKGMDPTPEADKIRPTNNTTLNSSSLLVSSGGLSERRIPGFLSSNEVPPLNMRDNEPSALSPGPSHEPSHHSVGHSDPRKSAGFFSLYSPLMLPGPFFMPSYPNVFFQAMKNAPKAKTNDRTPKIWQLPQCVNTKYPSISTHTTNDGERVCKNNVNGQQAQYPSSSDLTSSLQKPEDRDFTSPSLLSSDCLQDQDRLAYFVNTAENAANIEHHHKAELGHKKSPLVFQGQPQSANSFRENIHGNIEVKEVAEDNVNNPNETNQSHVKRPPPLKFSVEAIMGRS